MLSIHHRVVLLGTCLGLIAATLVPAREVVGAEFRPQCLAPGLYYGPAPEGPADYRRLQQLGVRQLIDLRSFKKRASGDEQRQAARLGMTYQRAAVGFTPSYPDACVEAVLTALRKQSHGPIYVHCTLGRDRTGMIVALYRQRYLGWSAQCAFEAKKRDEFNGMLVHYDRYFWDSVQDGSRASTACRLTETSAGLE